MSQLLEAEDSPQKLQVLALEEVGEGRPGSQLPAHLTPLPCSVEITVVFTSAAFLEC